MAKFVLICGPQAVGKMTVGQELAKLTGLKFMHNHETIDLPLKFFEFKSEQRERLTDLFRFSIFEEVAKSDLKGMIFTLMWAFERQEDWDWVQRIKDIYDTSSDRLIEWQENFKKCVDFVYNLNGNEDLKEKNKLSKFIAYTIKDSDFYTYSQGIEVITDNYINIHNKHHYDTLEKLIKEIDNKNQELELHNVYTSNNLTSICFMVLDQIVRHENLQIKTCLNCGRYFIPTYRQNEIYCDLANVDKSPTCKEKGAGEQYRKNLENNKVQALYRRIYQQKFMTAYRNKESKAIQKEFDQWKKEAKDKISKIKKGKLTEDEVYKWLVENK